MSDLTADHEPLAEQAAQVPPAASPAVAPASGHPHGPLPPDRPDSHAPGPTPSRSGQAPATGTPDRYGPDPTSIASGHAGTPAAGHPADPTSVARGHAGAPTPGWAAGYPTNPTSGAVSHADIPTSGHPTDPTSGARGDAGAPTSRSAAGYGADPTSGAGGPGGYGAAPVSEGPGPVGYTPDPASGAGASGTYGPTSRPRTDGPTSGAEASNTHGPGPGAPDTHGPASGAGPSHAYGPTSGAGTPDRYGLDPTPDPFGLGAPLTRGPRIEPSPPPQRNRLLLGLLAGLLSGLLLFGIGGFVLGRTTADPAAASDPAGVPTQQPSPAPALGVYEQSQVALNQTRLTGALAPLAQGWLPYLSACDRNGEPGGPALNRGEKARVRCRFDGMSVIFVEYATVADRDKARVKTLGQNVDARTLAPGAGAAGEKVSPSGRTTGSYVEYAYTVTERQVPQTVSGIWWDDAGTPVAAYMLAYWKGGVGESWAPMREVWARYA